MTERRPKLTLERTFDASPEEVWELWTTREGIESWWGPDGFKVEVESLDLRDGGDCIYAMSATGPEQVDFMTKAGMPLITQHRLTYTAVDPPHRLAYRSIADFVPDVDPYEVDTVVELQPVDGGVRMVLTFDAMHDGHWTELAKMGHESELARLERVLMSRHQ